MKTSVTRTRSDSIELGHSESQRVTDSKTESCDSMTLLLLLLILILCIAAADAAVTEFEVAGLRVH
eukprot:3646337-Rhodomonas_salina.3